MKRSDDWLQKVEKILLSDSSNFNILCEIAGVDPSVLFLGTAMDGADFRGQDMRRFRFTNLDIRTVKTDHNTILPDQPTEVFPDGREWGHDRGRVAVLFDGDEIPVAYREYTNRELHDVDIFKRADASKFIEFIHQSSVVPIIFTESKTILDRGFINDTRLSGCINLMRVGSAQELRISLEFAGINSRPTVLIPYGMYITGHYGSKRSVLESIRFLADNFHSLKLAFGKENAVALFSSDSQARTAYEAWVQIFDRSFSFLRSSTHRPSIFIDRTVNLFSYQDVGPTLIGDADVFDLIGGGSSRAKIMLAVPISANVHPKKRDLEKILPPILTARGWALAVGRNIAGSDDADIEIVGVNRFKLNIRNSTRSGAKKNNNDYKGVVSYFGDTNEDTIIVEEGVSDLDFIYSLMVRGELRLPLRAVSVFDPSSATVWPMISFRIRGLISSRKNELRGAFVKWLISSAGSFDQEGQHVADKLGNVYARYGDKSVTHIDKIEENEYVTSFAVYVGVGDLHSSTSAEARAIVSITDAGVRISDLSSFRGGDDGMR